MSALSSVRIDPNQYDDSGVDQVDRHGHKRMHFPCDLEITRSDGERLKATMQDISEDTVGLRHAIQLEVGEVVSGNVQGLPLDFEEFCIRVIWCKPAGAGFFQSGCQFVESRFDVHPSFHSAAPSIVSR